MDTSPDVLSLTPPTAADSRRRRGRGGATDTFRGSGGPAETAKAIGLAGEVVVGAWLHRHFGLPIEDTWESSYRLDVLADGKGNDRLGYDFRVELAEETWLIEVKSTTEDHLEFPLTDTEVARATELADNEVYVIAFVTHVLDPERCRIHLLPNPLGPGGLQYYQVVGKGLRLHFALDAEA